MPTLFDACRIINQAKDGAVTLTASDIDELKDVFRIFLVDILGIRTEMVEGASQPDAMKPFEQAVDLLLEVRCAGQGCQGLGYLRPYSRPPRAGRFRY